MGKSERHYYIWAGSDNYVIKHLTEKQALAPGNKVKKWAGNPKDTWEEAEKLRQHIEQEELLKLLEGHVQKKDSI